MSSLYSDFHYKRVPYNVVPPYLDYVYTLFDATSMDCPFVRSWVSPFRNTLYDTYIGRYKYGSVQLTYFKTSTIWQQCGIHVFPLQISHDFCVYFVSGWLYTSAVIIDYRKGVTYGRTHGRPDPLIDIYMFPHLKSEKNVNLQTRFG